MLRIIKNLSQKFYSEAYKDNAAGVTNDEWVKILSSKLHLTRHSKYKVLDVACGVSTLGKLFGNHVYGIDINPNAVKTVKKLGIKAKLGNVEKTWKYPDNFFDVVIASHIIEHVVNPDHILLEAMRVLKKGGIIVVATPNIAAWFNRILLLFGFQPFFTEVSTIDKTLGLKFTRKLSPFRIPLGHLRLFTLGALKDILTLHKFNIKKTVGAEFLSFPPIALALDKFFSNITNLSSNIIIIAKK